MNKDLLKYEYLTERQAISILRALAEEFREIAHEKRFLVLEPELSTVVRKTRALQAVLRQNGESQPPAEGRAVR